jgi:hypothetical protein
MEKRMLIAREIRKDKEKTYQIVKKFKNNQFLSK